MSQKRNYRFTHNNYEGTELEDTIKCKFIVYGKEIAPTTLTPHLQGFISFTSAKTLSAARKAMPGCDVRVSDFPEECIEYCKKDGDFTERGEWSTQKEKGDKEKRRWDEIRIAAEEGRLEDIPDDIRFLNHDLIKRHRNDALRDRKLEDTETQHLWYYGDSGTGKSRKAREENPDAYLKMCNKWWDGYKDEDVVIIEDFDKKHDVLGHHMKIWGDRYPYPVEVKGGAYKIRPKLIIVTSNYHPKDIWEDNTTLLPILRRYKCIEFKMLATN